MENPGLPLSKDEIKKLPPSIESFVQIIMSESSYMELAADPLISKINESHIDTILRYAEREKERKYRMSIHQRIYAISILLVFIGLFVFIAVWFAGDKDTLLDIIKILAGFLGGFGGGYGLRAYSKKENNNQL